MLSLATPGAEAAARVAFRGSWWTSWNTTSSSMPPTSARLDSAQRRFVRGSLTWERTTQPGVPWVIEVSETDYPDPGLAATVTGSPGEEEGRQDRAEPQPLLRPQGEGEDEAIVSNVLERPKVIWLFYQQRRCAENYSKEL